MLRASANDSLDSRADLPTLQPSLAPKIYDSLRTDSRWSHSKATSLGGFSYFRCHYEEIPPDRSAASRHASMAPASRHRHHGPEAWLVVRLTRKTIHSHAAV